MQATLQRRGPDQEGLYRTPQAALVHTRLCVMDPAGGAQPMLLRRGEEELALVYNGELYNTPELRTAMEGWLPEEVLQRNKSPYPKTHHPACRSCWTPPALPCSSSWTAPPWWNCSRRAPRRPGTAS